MINPDERVPQDDTYDNDAEDQQSQSDIHSNGFDETDEPLDDDTTDADLLKQAYDAAESSFTLYDDDEEEDEAGDE